MAADNLRCGGDTITAIFGSFQKDLEIEQEKREVKFLISLVVIILIF